MRSWEGVSNQKRPDKVATYSGWFSLTEVQKCCVLRGKKVMNIENLSSHKDQIKLLIYVDSWLRLYHNIERHIYHFAIKNEIFIFLRNIFDDEQQWDLSFSFPLQLSTNLSVGLLMSRGYIRK